MLFMKLVALSDTHTLGRQISVPSGDVLIHCGDLTFRGTQDETENELEWLSSLPHAKKLFVAGNHDWFFDPDAPQRFHDWGLSRSLSVPQMLERFPGLTYLCDSVVVIDGVKFYGSPWTPPFFDWAFNLRPGQAEDVWNRIPVDTDVLVTHGPPFGTLDWTFPDGLRQGCTALRDALPRFTQLKLPRVWSSARSIRRKGRRRYGIRELLVTTRDYNPVNEPFVLEIERP
jgi:Calcineurin-like phosphoesterase